MRPGARFAQLLLGCLCLSAPALGQTPSQPQPAPVTQPAYTFSTRSRIVLTDVSVTDRNGNPVHALPRSAFHIFDNKKPQDVVSFEEHVTGSSPAPVPQAPRPHGVYTNDLLLHPPSVLNILVLDLNNLRIEDQMYLRIQLTDFLKSLPATEQLAIYARYNSATFLLQDFMSNPGLLVAAVQRAMPRFTQPNVYSSDADTLHQLALYLGQLPGRKNVLWFSGGSALYLLQDATLLQENAPMRRIYDELEVSRIAIYPVDARGLTVTSTTGMIEQHFAMREVADATGGHAFYNNNGLKEITGRVLQTDSDFYTLTYSPKEYRSNNKWHKIQIKVDADYQLSYRHGYFADDAYGAAPTPARASRTHLLANGITAEEPASRSTPIVFEARILPASDPATAAAGNSEVAHGPPPPPKKNSAPYSVRYSLPAKDFTTELVGGKHRMSIGAVILAFNQNGSITDRVSQQLILTLNDAQLAAAAGARIPFEQAINLPKGENFLFLVVWDTKDGRLGTLQVPLSVTVPAKGASQPSSASSAP